jgi:FkbH-like protein
MVPLIELYLFGAGIAAEIYEADYGVFRQEILDPDSGLYRFGPKIVILITGWRDLSRVPRITDSAEQMHSLCTSEIEDWLNLWSRLHDRLGCVIIQNNFDLPLWRVLGNHDRRHPGGMSGFISRLNVAFQDQAPSHVIMHDVEQLASLKGREAWSDPRFYYYGKLPCAPEFLPEYAYSLSTLIATQTGRSKKCLIVDLDNTLWGGIVGEEGPEGIRVGAGDPEAEAFSAFQKYVKALGDRGIILGVCSKNEESTARRAFIDRPEMVLKLDDFSCFLANWDDKPTNLRLIAERLNIGLDSMVFVDDDAVERALARELMPLVAVPEMPEDPAGYIQALEKHRYFEITGLADEDLKRVQYYRANAAREVASSSSTSLREFLSSLQMKAIVAPVGPATLERSAQLINKTNQFNLTGRRYSTSDVASIAENPAWITLTVSLADRFGDNGLISVALGRIDDESLVIDTWVMSCRVFKRTVEQFIMMRLFEEAKRRGLGKIRAEFVPTERNTAAGDVYERLGFNRSGDGLDGRTYWSLSVSKTAPNWQSYIQEHCGR